jgi:hypothetical protein
MESKKRNNILIKFINENVLEGVRFVGDMDKPNLIYDDNYKIPSVITDSRLLIFSDFKDGEIICSINYSINHKKDRLIFGDVINHIDSTNFLYTVNCRKVYTISISGMEKVKLCGKGNISYEPIFSVSKPIIFFNADNANKIADELEEMYGICLSVT